MPLIINQQKVSEVICLNCYRRWIAARDTSVNLRDLECPTCGQQGYAIETGEIRNDMFFCINIGYSSRFEFSCSDGKQKEGEQDGK